jgi:hypothetical protein
VSRIDSTISTADLRRRLTDPDLTIVDVPVSPAYNDLRMTHEARAAVTSREPSRFRVPG